MKFSIRFRSNFVPKQNVGSIEDEEKCLLLETFYKITIIFNYKLCKYNTSDK